LLQEIVDAGSLLMPTLYHSDADGFLFQPS
jgi:hypothetical protein